MVEMKTVYDEMENLIKSFDENNKYGKEIRPTESTTGKFRAMSISGKSVIGLIEKFDKSFVHIYLNVGGELVPCYVRTLAYQTNVKSCSGLYLCEGDLIEYKGAIRVIECKKCGSRIDLSFRRLIDDGGNMNPIPLNDIRHKSDKIIRISNIFDNINDTSVLDMTTGEKVSGINQKLVELAPNELDEIIRHIDIIKERRVRHENGIEYPMPIKTGDKTMVEVEITDEDKAFNFFGKSLTGRADMSEYGFEVNSLSFSKDQYLDNIEDKLRNELLNTVGKTTTELYTTISNMLTRSENNTSLNKLK